MMPTSIQGLIAERVVKQYAYGLSTLDLDLIVSILDAEFKYVYRTGGRGHGISTDVKYIGHLYKTFAMMRMKYLTIHNDLCYLKYKGVNFLSIKLLPPHERSIIHPMEYQINEKERGGLPEQPVYLLPRVKSDLLCKIECYTAPELYQYGIELIEMEV
jgi:hypothetical protein